MRRYNMILFSLVAWMMGVALWLSPLSAFASDDSEITNPVVSVTVSKQSNADVNAIRNLCSTVNNDLAENDLFTSRTKNDDEKISGTTQYSFFTDFEEEDNLVSFQVNMRQYRKYTEEMRQDIMNIALTDIINSSISQTNKNKIYNDVYKLDEPITSLVRQLSDDVEADYVGAYAWFRKALPFVRLILGVVVLGMFILITLSSVFDLAYINLPIAQNMWPKAKSGDPFGVSKEAQSSVKQQADNSGKEFVNVNFLYFKSRAVNYVMLSLCILYLASGKIFEFVASCINYFRGFIG